ncbi:hypothetical protein QTP86_012012 [Hemibagrus guttatus]|nr:hypothetical protein QTP86_012012 [Hemibagrus guttatus]
MTRSKPKCIPVVVSEAKTRVWEEFGEAIEKDYWTASGKFWQTVRRLRRGKQLSANTVYGGGGELLVSTGDIVGRWKEYFEDLLNPTDTPSAEEPEAEDSEVDSFITQAEVTEVVQQLLGGKAPGVDEICPEYLKSLDVVGLSWLTHLCNIAWRSGTVPLDWATGVVVPLFKKGDRRVCSNYRGFTLLSLPGKVYSRVLERRVRPVLEGSWKFAQPVHMCFVDLEKAFDRVPRDILWEVLWEYGVHGPLLRAVRSLYNRSRSLVRIASCLDLQHALGRFAAECEAAGMRVSTSKSEAMVLDRKKVVCTLQVGGEVLPQVEEFKYLGVLFTSEERMDREIDRRIGAAAAVMQSMYWSVVVKKELSRKAKLSIYQSIYVPTLTYGHELWVMTERRAVEVARASVSDASGTSPWRGVPGMPHREEALGKTQDTLERLSLSAGLGTPRGPSGRAGGRVWGEGVSKTITTRSNQKPWMTAEVRALLKMRDSAFRAEDKAAFRTARAKLSRAIRKAKRTHTQRIPGQFQDSGNSQRMWQGMQKSAGPDNIPDRVLRECAEQLADVFTDIFNISLSSAVVPMCLKTTTIIPVPKKSTVSCLSDYHLVVLTPIVMKCFERFVMRHIKTQLPPSLDPLQLAYRPNRSTEDAITPTLHLSLTHLDNNDTHV